MWIVLDSTNTATQNISKVFGQKGLKKDPKIFRQMSLLPIISKITDKITQDRTME